MSTITDDTSTSTPFKTISSATLQTFSQPLSIKLDRTNFMIWKAQVVPIVGVHGLWDYLSGTSIPPPEKLLANNQPNPDFLLWDQHDQLLLGWLLSSLTQPILTLVAHATTSADAWKTITKAFSQQEYLNVPQLNNLWKGSLNVPDFVKTIVDNVTGDLNSSALSNNQQGGGIKRVNCGSASGGPRLNEWIEVLSWEPRAFIYHNFLAKEECEHLISLALPHLKRSAVFDRETGRGKHTSRRTSFDTVLKRGGDKVISAIEKRIADFTFMPVENGEGFQVIRYEVGEKFEPHFDYFPDEFIPKNGGQRMVTILMYLSDVEEGGETVFPNAVLESGQKGLSVKPKMGDALLFWSLKPDTSVDPSSKHGGSPVIRGCKWACTQWMHVREYKI